MNIFIGGSKESLSLATEIAITIEEHGHIPRLWNEYGLFSAGSYTLESLESICNDVDAAIFVFSEDDKTLYREALTQSVRDNTLIEYGLFIGRLSRERVVFCRKGVAKIATDLLGVTHIDYDMPIRANAEIKKWLDLLSNKKEFEGTKGDEKIFYHHYGDGKEGKYMMVESNHAVVEANNFYQLSQEYYHYGEYKKALRLIDKALLADPDNYIYHNHKGIILDYIVFTYKIGDLTQSNNSYTKALTLKPDFAFGYRNRALNNMRLKKYNESIEDYSRAIDINPNCPKYYRERAYVYTALKDFKKAHDDTGKALAVDEEG
ncbi:MAG: nucleotide-binding protein [Oscillospiraceae bacterium]|nr:nucleotide-binding protein [Oscillospiraceae bacterium]